jgi:8-oxo-dGTP pyrophosphatase MutT (NUDIX family)
VSAILEPFGSANIGAACALFDLAGRVLLVRHTYGRLNWELPGGACLPGEEPAAGARRELEEEAGLNVGGGRLSGVYFEPGHERGPTLHFVFRLERPIGVEPVARPPEIDAVGWFALDDLPAPISDFTELRARDALRDRVAYAVVPERQWRTQP